MPCKQQIIINMKFTVHRKGIVCQHSPKNEISEGLPHQSWQPAQGRYLLLQRFAPMSVKYGGAFESKGSEVFDGTTCRSYKKANKEYHRVHQESNVSEDKHTILLLHAQSDVNVEQIVSYLGHKEHSASLLLLLIQMKPERVAILLSRKFNSAVRVSSMLQTVG